MGMEFLVKDGILEKYSGANAIVEIPEGIVEIGQNAFAENQKIVEVIMPDSVLKIGPSAFRECSNLTSIRFSDALKKVWTDAFYKCINLMEVELPSSVRELANGTFGACDKLTSFKCYSRTFDVLGNPFRSNEAKKPSQFIDKDGFLIIDNILYDYTGTAKDVIVPDGVTHIANGIFASKSYSSDHKRNIETIILPDSVIYMGDGVFQYNSQLKNIAMPSGIQLGDYNFVGCWKLVDENGWFIYDGTAYVYVGEATKVVVPEGVKRLATYLFNQNICSEYQNIHEVYLPESLEVIGDYAFLGCTLLNEITIPESVNNIGERAFADCIHLQHLKFPQSVEKMGEAVFTGCKGLADQMGYVIQNHILYGYYGDERNLVIPDGITTIGYGVFNDKDILSVQLPKSLRTMECCFRDCRVLAEIEIPDGVSALPDNIFDGCTSLKSVVLPSSITHIGSHAFAKCESLTEIQLPNQVETLKYGIFWKCLQLTQVTLPSSLKNIESYAFFECSSLKKITIPKSVVYIKKKAFEGCKALCELNSDEMNEAIDLSVFSECAGLANENGMLVLKHNLLKCFGKDKTAVVPEGVTAIDSGAFCENTSVEKIMIPASVTKVDTQTFINCWNLSEIVVDDNNMHYSSKDGVLFNRQKDTLLYFPQEKNSKKYVVPTCVTAIADKAFSLYFELERIVISPSITCIGDEVFFFLDEKTPLVYPTLPISLVKEPGIQIRLCLGYCLNSKLYKGEYADNYREYAIVHQKEVLKRAKTLKLPAVQAFYEQFLTPDSKVNAKEEPKKKLNEQEKVELLEETILKGDVKQVKAVLDEYKNFEFTARALGIACLYTDLNVVQCLVESGFSFAFEYSPNLKRKYGSGYRSGNWNYPAEYSLMLAVTDIDVYLPTLCVNSAKVHFGELPDIKAERNSEKTRAEITAYLLEANCCFNAEDVLYYALLWGCTAVAECLLNHGVTLSQKKIFVLRTSTILIERGELMATLPALSPKKCLYALRTFQRSIDVGVGDGKILLTQKIFESESESIFHPDVLGYILHSTDTSKLSKTKILERAIELDNVAALEAIVNAGVLNNANKREKAIQYATDNKKQTILAWLLDFKNRTVDFKKEKEKEEANLLKELNQDPNSVSTLKKIWSYKILEDNTLEITSYKGDSDSVEIPATIGNRSVSSIGEWAFAVCGPNIRAERSVAREKIKSVVIPEGVTELKRDAFAYCHGIEHIFLPSTLKKIGTDCFLSCQNLWDMSIPIGVKQIGRDAFCECTKLLDNQNLLIQNNILYASDMNKGAMLTVPDGVVEIFDNVFQTKVYSYERNCIHGIKLPESLRVIGANVFRGTQIQEIKLPQGLHKIGAEALKNCEKLQDLYMPESLEEIGEHLLGVYDDENIDQYGEHRAKGILVHAKEGSIAAEYMKAYSGVRVVND